MCIDYPNTKTINVCVDYPNKNSQSVCVFVGYPNTKKSVNVYVGYPDTKQSVSQCLCRLSKQKRVDVYR